MPLKTMPLDEGVLFPIKVRRYRLMNVRGGYRVVLLDRRTGETRAVSPLRRSHGLAVSWAAANMTYRPEGE